MSLTSYRAAPPRVEGDWGRLGPWGLSCEEGFVWFPVGRPGDDRLSRVLGRSTIGAEGFHGRVRNGIGCWAPRYDHQVVRPEGRSAVLCAVRCVLEGGWRRRATRRAVR